MHEDNRTARVSATARSVVLAPVALGCIALQYPSRPGYSALAAAAWLAASAVFDRAILARMWQPRFLAVSAVLAALSGLLLGAPDARLAGVAVSRAGVEAGVVMILRGILIVGIGAWIARWLLARASFARSATGSRVSSAAAAAFDLVPELRSRIQAVRAARSVTGARTPVSLEQAVISLVCQTAWIAEGLWRQTPTAARPGEGEHA